MAYLPLQQHSPCRRFEKASLYSICISITFSNQAQDQDRKTSHPPQQPRTFKPHTQQSPQPPQAMCHMIRREHYCGCPASSTLQRCRAYRAAPTGGTCPISSPCSSARAVVPRTCNACAEDERSDIVRSAKKVRGWLGWPVISSDEEDER